MAARHSDGAATCRQKAMLTMLYSREIGRRLKDFRKNCGGQVAITFGLAAIPITISVGAAVDYSHANWAKAQLDAYADAAALSVVSKSALGLSAATAKQNAINFFKAQAKTS